MNKLIFLVLFSTAALGAEDFQIPMQRALEFNRWYIKQVNNDRYPIQQGNEIDKFVTTSTMKKLRHADDPRYADAEFYEADFLLNRSISARTGLRMWLLIRMIQTRSV